MPSTTECAKGSGVAHRTHCVIHVLDQKVHNLNPDYFSHTVSKLALERKVALQAQALAAHSQGVWTLARTDVSQWPTNPDQFRQKASLVNLVQNALTPQMWPKGRAIHGTKTPASMAAHSE